MLYLPFWFLVKCVDGKLFAESEFWFASIKVMAIVIFIILGVAAMVGSFQ